MNPSITFHYFNEADLEAVLPRVREAFSRAGMDFDACMAEGMIGFERMSEAVQNASDSLLKLSAGLEHLQSKLDLFELRKTAWERRNPNQPWYSRFQRKQRRHA